MISIDNRGGHAGVTAKLVCANRQIARNTVDVGRRAENGAASGKGPGRPVQPEIKLGSSEKGDYREILVIPRRVHVADAIISV